MYPLFFYQIKYEVILSKFKPCVSNFISISRFAGKWKDFTPWKTSQVDFIDENSKFKTYKKRSLGCIEAITVSSLYNLSVRLSNCFS